MKRTRDLVVGDVIVATEGEWSDYGICKVYTVIAPVSHPDNADWMDLLEKGVLKEMDYIEIDHFDK